MQHASRASIKFDDNDTYRMMVLRFDEPEEDIDRHFLQTALDLGINIPQDPKTTIDLITHNVSHLSLEAPASTSPEPPVQPLSSTSQSTPTASDSSSEQHRHRKTPSLAATSITSAPSISSLSSQKSSYVKIRKGFRRISTIRRRKTLAVQTPALPVRPATSHLTRPDMQHRAITADPVITISSPQPHASTPSLSPTGKPTGRRKVASYVAPTPPVPVLNTSPPPPSPSPVPFASFDHDSDSSSKPPPSDPDALSRSLSHPLLKKLRTTQLQEQLRFISFQASQTRLMHAKHLQQKRDALSTYRTLQSDTETRHADALTNLENRHLSAEADLRRTLDMERQACDVRLKHMQAYCNPRSNVQGMPERTVTKADYRQLEQQYHVRNGMENLHASRINVLREKQAKQLERIIAKQEAETEKQATDLELENEELEQQFQGVEEELKRGFKERKRRLVKRWGMAEAIERRKLELETGEMFAELPLIEWGDDKGADGDPRRESCHRIADERRSAEVQGEGRFDALNMI